MLQENWIKLNYIEQKNALRDAIINGEDWEWNDKVVWASFFEGCPDIQSDNKDFVDVQRLNIFFGNREFNDSDCDPDLDTFQHAVYSSSLFDNLRETLLNSSESSELLILRSVGATFASVNNYWINVADPDGQLFAIRFTKIVFSDGRADLFLSPFDETDLHLSIDEDGEWMEIDGDEVEIKLTEDEVMVSFLDVEVPNIDDKLLRDLMSDSESGEGIEIPTFDPLNDLISKGLGDSLYD